MRAQTYQRHWNVQHSNRRVATKNSHFSYHVKNQHYRAKKSAPSRCKTTYTALLIFGPFAEKYK